MKSRVSLPDLDIKFSIFSLTLETPDYILRDHSY